MLSVKTVAVALGVSLCGISWYVIYKILQKDEDDDYKNPSFKSKNFKTIEFKVPKHLVRELIGRNGSNINLIQDVSGTKIHLKNTEKDAENICIIRGTIEACHTAEHILKEFVANQPLIESEEFLVPKGAAGKIIGRLGMNIADIQSISGAKVNVSNDNLTGDTKVSLKGSAEQIVIAKSMVMKKVEEFNSQNNKIESCLQKREPRLPQKTPTNSTENLNVIPTSKMEKMSPFQGNQDAPFEVYVSAMTNPSKFWIQIVGPKAAELDQLVEEMTDYYNLDNIKDSHRLDKISKGDLVAAVFQFDNKWYRAEVLDVFEDKDDQNSQKAELYYLDYGDTDVVPCSQIRELRTDFLRLHFQAIECSLANVEPIDEEWSEEAIDKFEDWAHVAQWEKLSAKIYGYSARSTSKKEGSPVPGIDLYDVTNDGDINIGQELIKNGSNYYFTSFD